MPLRLLPFRLHARAIVRDGKAAFLGSQSLRKLELEARREIGVIFSDKTAIKKMIAVFEHDWASAKPLATDTIESAMEIPVRRVAKIVAKHIHVKPVVEQMLEKVLERSSAEVPFEPNEVAQTVREAFRDEVHDAVLLALRDMASQASQLPLHQPED